MNENINNVVTWGEERVDNRISAIRALNKARKMESCLLKSGHRYIKVNSNTQVLVPCDKHGKPTKEGEKIIEKISRCVWI